MRTSLRVLIAVGVLLLLGGLAVLGWWYQTGRQHATGQAAGTLTVEVTSGADRGPGTLREALFIVAASNGKADVRLRVRSIAPETPLPPLVNPHGVRLLAQEGATEINAHALGGGPVLDVAGANTSIEGLQLRNCPGSAILLRAAQFRLRATTIEACDVGVDAEVVETRAAAQTLLQMGCTFGQGYFFSPPVDAEVAFQQLRSSARVAIGESGSEPETLGPAGEGADDSPTVMLPAGTILESRIRDDSAAPEDRDGTVISGG